MTSESVSPVQEESANKEKQPRLTPRCPFCSDDPAKIISSSFEMGDVMAVTMYCANLKCRKIITIQIVGPSGRAMMEQQRLIVPPNGRPI